jgi:hypothetical protein
MDYIGIPEETGLSYDLEMVVVRMRRGPAVFASIRAE